LFCFQAEKQAKTLRRSNQQFAISVDNNEKTSTNKFRFRIFRKRRHFRAYYKLRQRKRRSDFLTAERWFLDSNRDSARLAIDRESNRADSEFCVRRPSNVGSTESPVQCFDSRQKFSRPHAFRRQGTNYFLKTFLILKKFSYWIFTFPIFSFQMRSLCSIFKVNLFKKNYSNYGTVQWRVQKLLFKMVTCTKSNN